MLQLDGRGTLQDQIYRSLGAQILAGRLRAGARLPSSRTLASELGVSRNTVVAACEQLLAEGYARRRPRSGLYVARDLPHFVTSLSRQRPSSRRAKGPSSKFARHLLREAGKLPLTWEARSRRLPYDFSHGRPSLREFPYATWSRIVARRLRGSTERSLDYGPTQGVKDLREELAQYLARSRGVQCDPEQILIVSGTQQALDLAARVILDPGELAVIEDPHYRPARLALSAVGAQLKGVRVDDEGIRVSDLLKLRSSRLVYVTPSHQFPTGVVMSAARRLALLDWAARVGAFVLEDDYDSEYRFSGNPIDALHGLDPHGRVIYMGTFSKLMFPALRIGYLVLPESCVAAFRAAKALTDTGNSSLEQLALADFVHEGHFERHIRRSRARHKARRAALLAAAERYLGDRVRIEGASAGLHMLLSLPGVRSSAEKSIMKRAAERGVGVYPAAPLFLSAPRRAGLLLGHGALTEPEIDEGISRLAAVLP